MFNESPSTLPRATRAMGALCQESAMLEVRPHGPNNRLGFIPCDTLARAYAAHRIFGGYIIHVSTGIDYTPATPAK